MHECSLALADLYPSVFKFSACVMPSRENDDVIISPYNRYRHARIYMCRS